MCRLKNIEAGYRFPKKWTDKVGMQFARIYARGTNLLCFSGFKLWDPEIGTPYNNGMRYPIMRSCSIGLEITFK
jgi:hypothetical protein